MQNNTWNISPVWAKQRQVGDVNCRVLNAKGKTKKSVWLSREACLRKAPLPDLSNIWRGWHAKSEAKIDMGCMLDFHSIPDKNCQIKGWKSGWSGNLLVTLKCLCFSQIGTKFQSKLRTTPKIAAVIMLFFLSKNKNKRTTCYQMLKFKYLVRTRFEEQETSASCLSEKLFQY